MFLINKMGADESSIKTKRNKQISKNKFLNEDEFCKTENNENNYNNNNNLIKFKKSRSLSISSQLTNQSITDIYTLESIINKFSKIQNHEQFPYNIICTIQVKFQKSNKKEYFTGFLINSNTVITLASNLYNQKYNENASEVIIFINSLNKIEIKKSNFILNKDYKKLDNDLIALLIEENNISLDNKILIADIGNNNNLNNLEFILINSLNTNFNSDDKKIHEIYLKYENDLYSYYNEGNLNQILNQSKGSPIIYKNDNNLYIIGIFNRQYKITLFNNENLKFFENCIKKSKKLRKKSVSNIINIYNYVY